MLPYNILATTRINGIFQALVDVRQLPGKLVFSGRVPEVPATDAEILARYVQYWKIADLVADDQRAGVYNSGKLTYETTTIPNLKHGTNLTQEFLNQLQAIAANGGLTNDNGYFSDYENRILDGLLFGTKQRKEALIIAMMLDGLTYNRLGIQTSASWGMPSDLKITANPTWAAANAATAHPIQDILTAKRFAAVRYGDEYNRITLSTADFILMTGTTEFGNRARWVLPPALSAASLNLQNLDDMKALAMRILGVGTIELYDYRAWEHNSDGTFTAAALLPVGNVILDDSRNDGDSQIWDVANSIVTESVVSSLVGNQNGGGAAGILGGFGGPSRGPVAYATAPVDMNPPNITYWSVARQFPRKKRLSANAVIYTGVTVDPIAFTVPY